MYYRLVLLLTCSLLVNADICPHISGCGICLTMLEGYLEYQCSLSENHPIFIFQYKPNDKLTIKCSDERAKLDDFPVHNLSDINSINVFILENCYIPPDFSIAEFSKRIGIENITTLYFQDVTFNNTLSAKNFHGLSDVLFLSLMKLNLTYLDENLLEGMPNLEKLNLLDNRVNVSQNFFKNVQKLMKVELAQNHITKIEPKTFMYLPNLISLNIWQNQITNISKYDLFNLGSLESLELSKNPIKEIAPEAFSTLSSLNIIQMGNTELTSLPKNLFINNTKIQEIKIYNNQVSLADMPDEIFANLVELERVILIGCKLNYLYDHTFKGSVKLKEIDLSLNNLSKLPQDLFKGLVNLERLLIQHNYIEHIPNTLFQDLKHLKLLDLTGNEIKEINNFMLKSLPSLINLQMSKNEISSIDPNAFGLLQNIEEINLADNNLTLEYNLTFDLSPFHTCIQLQRLKLSNNSISNIFDDWKFNIHLRFLDLRYNKFNNLSEYDIQFLSTDLLLDLRYNNISKIDLNKSLLEIRSVNLTTSTNFRIDISNNPINCNCLIYNFKSLIEDRLKPTAKYLITFIMEPLNCVEPKYLENKNIKYVRSEDLVCEASDFGKGCPDKCSCKYSPEKQALLVDCSNRGLKKAPAALYKYYFHSAIHLNISGNQLDSLPEIGQENYKFVTKMYASHNQITHITPKNILPSLEVLEVDHNDLTILSSEAVNAITNSSIHRLILHENPWSCACEARDFLIFIQTEYEMIPKTSSVICSANNKAFIDLTINDLCETSEFIIIISIVFSCLAFVLAIILISFFRYQNEVKIWLYAHQFCLRFITEDDLDKHKPYDAFISYSHKDEHFVVNELVKKLENGPRPYKLCLHYRDWMAGDLIPSQIARSVEDSKRTIIVLSKNFLTSVWGAMEFRAAHRQALVEGRARVIIVIYGDVPSDNELDTELKAYLNMNTYVQWGDKWFWDKLRYAMPHGPRIRGIGKGMNKNNNVSNSMLVNAETHYNGIGNSMLNMPSVLIIPNKLNEQTEEKKKTDNLNVSGKEMLLNGSIGNKEVLHGIFNASLIKNDDKFDDKFNDTVNEDDGFNNKTAYDDVIFNFDHTHSTTV